MTRITIAREELQQCLQLIARQIEQDKEPATEDYFLFMQTPELVFQLIELLQTLDENSADDEDSALYSACLFALDVCVTQLKSASDCGHHWIEKTLTDLMINIADAIRKYNHPLGFWLPILNVFYDAHVELVEPLKDAYLALAAEEEIQGMDDDWSHLTAIKELIAELADASVFDIADNFFAQSAAMPPDFFVDLVMDLYSIDEGHEIALLTLLHPNKAVREVVMSTLNEVLPSITLSSIALSRLRAIKEWYPLESRPTFDRWIKQQRKKGVVFATIKPSKLVSLKSSEVDGSGAQGVFVQVSSQRKTQLCGLLFKQSRGIKDAWMTTNLTRKEVLHYQAKAFDDTLVLRSIDMDYLQVMTNHFLAVTLERQDMPQLHLLAIQEALGLAFIPQKLDAVDLLNNMVIEIVPFTESRLSLALKNSYKWAKKKNFIDSWYIENQLVDKCVNRYSTFVDGVKTCQASAAMAAVFAQEIEVHRAQWLFHFVWIGFWLKSGAKKTETSWQESILIAHAIHSGIAMQEIPVMQVICEQSVANSIETMQDRRSHLTKE